MSDMVEHVARAIAAADMEDFSEDAERYLTRARAAIAAMREPDKCVVKAMCKAMSPEHRPTPDRVGVAEKHRIRWRAAIDRVLSDGVE